MKSAKFEALQKQKLSNAVWPLRNVFHFPFQTHQAKTFKFYFGGFGYYLKQPTKIKLTVVPVGRLDLSNLTSNLTNLIKFLGSLG